MISNSCWINVDFSCFSAFLGAIGHVFKEKFFSLMCLVGLLMSNILKRVKVSGQFYVSVDPGIWI